MKLIRPTIKHTYLPYNLQQNPDESLVISYQNVRGLNTKLTRLYTDSFDYASSVTEFAEFTETWLKRSILDSEILFCNYIV